MHLYAYNAYTTQVITSIYDYILMSNLKSKYISSTNSILKLSDIYKEFSNDNGNQISEHHVILNKLNLEINEGEFVTIVGPSGCGKRYIA